MITREEVLKIVKLAALSVADEDEVTRLTNNLNSILDYVNQLEKYDLSGVEPMSHVHGITNVFREDEVKPSLDPEAALSNAPDKIGRFIKFPLIVN